MNADRLRRFRGLATRPQLIAAGVDPELITANLNDLQWRRIGPAIVLHCGPLTPDQQLRAALCGHGQVAMLASFTALEAAGLQGWERSEIHLIAPTGTPEFQHPELPVIRLHTVARPPRAPGQYLEPAAEAAIRAGAECCSDRTAAGLLAATVGQAVASLDALRNQLVNRDANARHDASVHDANARRDAMCAAVADMRQDCQSLQDIDLVELCRQQHVPMPSLQQVRPDAHGRQRFLEAVWDLADGEALVVEVDCALQQTARRWWDEALRPSDFTFSSAGVLRVPSAVLRHESNLVFGILRRVIANHRAAG